MPHSPDSTQPANGTRRFWPVLLGFSAVALFFLWEEHQAHLLGALPYLIFLLCPLMHLFMHHGHRHDHDRH